jgi:four helix bundle protein
MIVEGYGRQPYKADFFGYLVYAITERDETIVNLDFLFETKSWKDEQGYHSLRNDYDTLSKRINLYIQWVEDNL